MTMAEGDLAVAEMHFVRDQPIAPQPPPRRTHGRGRLAARQPAVDAVQHRADDRRRAAAALDRPGACSTSCIIDAVWTGDGSRGLPRHRAAPRGRRLLAVRLGAPAYFIYGSYPIPERWRVDVFFVLLAIGVAWLLWLSAPRRDLGALYFFVVLPIVLVHSAARLRRDRPAGGRDRRCGAACW